MNNKYEALKFIARQKPELMQAKDVAGKLPMDYVSGDLELKDNIKGLTN